MIQSEEAKMVEDLYKPIHWEDKEIPDDWPQKVVDKIREIEGWFPLNYATHGHSLLLQRAVGEIMLPLELEGKEKPEDLENEQLLSQWFTEIIKNSIKHGKPEFEVKVFFYTYRDGAFTYRFKALNEEDNSFWNKFYQHPTRENLIECVWKTLTIDTEEID